jgi:hypothetical protein
MTLAALEDRFGDYRPELRSTPAARAAARYLVFSPPLPLLVRPAYLGLSFAALSLLPDWARAMLALPVPAPIRLWAPVAGQAVVGAVRWATQPAPAPAAE